MKKIVVIGDQVCADALPVVRGCLEGKAEIWSPSGVVSSTPHLLAGLKEWLLKRQPDVVLFACSMDDTRKLCHGEEERLVPLSHFSRNLRCVLRLTRERSTAIPIWATITPVDVRCVAARNGDEESEEFGYDNETISLYNEEAKAVAASLGVRALDLYGFVKAASRGDSKRTDGIRFDERSSDVIARRIVKELSTVGQKA